MPDRIIAALPAITNPPKPCRIKRKIGLDLVAPFGVYVNDQQVANYQDDEAAAERHYQQLRARGLT